MAEKFEVGKKYKYRNVPGSQAFGVKYVGAYRSFVQFSDGMECAIHTSDATLYDEYHEPRVEKFERFVTRYENSAVTVTCTPSDQYGWKILGEIEIILTDGKLSSVNIVEGE